MIFWFYLLVFILGLCCGSFVNMLVYRTAKNYGLMKGDHKSRPYNKNRSFCDYCGRQLRWYENIPVISWLIQKGKTRCCGKKLPVLYPITEMATGVLFLLYGFLGRPQESPLQFGLGLLIIVFLVFSAVFDAKYMILPDFSTVILVFGALVIWITGHFGEWNYLWPAVISFGFLGLLSLIKIKGQEAMGRGDVKLAFFMGLFLGKSVIIAFYMAFIIGALVALVLMIFKKAGRKTLIPFGPFLILGTFLTWFFGNSLMNLSFFYFIR